MTRKQDTNHIKHFCQMLSRQNNPTRINGLRGSLTGNHDEAFLETWHENLQLFSLTLMWQVINFCDLTISKVNDEIEKKLNNLTETNYFYPQKQ